MWTGFIILGQSPVAGSYEHGDEPSGPIKDRQFTDKVRDYQDGGLLG
jgi:hypothetical protein